MSIYIKSLITISSLCILSVGTVIAQEKKTANTTVTKTDQTTIAAPSINVSEVKPTELKGTAKKTTFKAVAVEVKADTNNVNHKFKQSKQADKK